MGFYFKLPVLEVWSTKPITMYRGKGPGIDLHFSHQSTFVSRRQNVSPSWAVWRLRGPMVFILAYYCLHRWMWYLQAFGNCSQWWSRLVEVYNFLVLADFFWFSHVKQRGTEFEGRSWNTSTGTPIDSNYVNKPIGSFSKSIIFIYKALFTSADVT